MAGTGVGRLLADAKLSEHLDPKDYDMVQLVIKKWKDTVKFDPMRNDVVKKSAFGLLNIQSFVETVDRWQTWLQQMGRVPDAVPAYRSCAIALDSARLSRLADVGWGSAD